jgi:hypothetical protein
MALGLARRLADEASLPALVELGNPLENYLGNIISPVTDLPREYRLALEALIVAAKDQDLSAAAMFGFFMGRAELSDPLTRDLSERTKRRKGGLKGASGKVAKVAEWQKRAREVAEEVQRERDLRGAALERAVRRRWPEGEPKLVGRKRPLTDFLIAEYGPSRGPRRRNAPG